MKNLYCYLLSFYPIEFHLQFADEMTAAFVKSALEHRRKGRVSYFRFVARELFSLLVGAAKERTSNSRQTLEAAALLLPSDRRALEKLAELTSRSPIYSIANHDFARARFYDRLERKLRNRLDELAA
jgi:hypothetical protein